MYIDMTDFFQLVNPWMADVTLDGMLLVEGEGED